MTPTASTEIKPSKAHVSQQGCSFTSGHHSWHWKGCPATGWWSPPSPSRWGFLTRWQTSWASCPSSSSSVCSRACPGLSARNLWVQRVFCALGGLLLLCRHLSVRMGGWGSGASHSVCSTVGKGKNIRVWGQVQVYDLNHSRRASLAAQRLRICLPMEQTWVWSLVQEDPTCHWATESGPVNSTLEKGIPSDVLRMRAGSFPLGGEL